MMLRKKNTRWAQLKYLSVLPLAALSISIFARSEVPEKFDAISSVKISDFTSMNEVNVDSIPDKKFETLTSDVDSSFLHKKNLRIGGATNALCIVDGIEISDIKSLNPENIESITVLKDAKSTAFFGEKGANGVILVTTKRGDTHFTTGKYTTCHKDSTSLLKYALPSISRPLYIVDGVEVPEISSLKPQNIESVSVLKDATSTKLYGEKGADGVILVTTKRLTTVTIEE